MLSGKSTSAKTKEPDEARVPFLARATFAPPADNSSCWKEEISYGPAVCLFLDKAVSAAVGCLVRRLARRVRLVITGRDGIVNQVLISMSEEAGNVRFLAHTEDVCFFSEPTPGLFVRNESARELEEAIFLYLSGCCSRQQSVSAEILKDEVDCPTTAISGGSSDRNTGKLLKR